MMNKKLLLIFMIIITTISCSFGASSGGINVVLANQNPDPVSPGNYVYVNVKVSNPGSEAVEEANIKFEENEYFSLAPGVESTKNLGTIPQFSTSSGSSSFVIAKYKVYVSPKTPIGLNTLTVSIDSSQADFEKDLDLLVQDSNPSVAISSFSIEPVESGKTTPLSIELKNNNNIDMKNVEVTLGLEEVENKLISVEKGSNQKSIGTLLAGENSSIDFSLSIAPDAVAKPYLLPITITFEDAIGNSYKQEVTGSVRVFSEPQLSLQIDSQSIYSEGRGTITLALANPGTSAVKGVQVEFLDSQAYTILEGKRQYIGDMNPDDFQTLQSDIYLSGEQDTLDVKLTYLDSYNNREEKIVSLDLTTFDEDSLQTYGINNQTGGSGFISTLIWIVLLVVVFVLGRKYGFRKAKRKYKSKQ